MPELSSDEWTAIHLSLKIAIVATVVALPFGLAVAWLLALVVAEWLARRAGTRFHGE